MEAVFPPGIFRIFSDDFRKDPLGKHWKLSESTGKFPTGMLLPTFSYFPLQNGRFPPYVIYLGF
jgi:hypothetical protein